MAVKYAHSAVNTRQGERQFPWAWIDSRWQVNLMEEANRASSQHRLNGPRTTSRNQTTTTCYQQVWQRIVILCFMPGANGEEARARAKRHALLARHLHESLKYIASKSQINFSCVSRLGGAPTREFGLDRWARAPFW